MKCTEEVGVYTEGFPLSDSAWQVVASAALNVQLVWDTLEKTVEMHVYSSELWVYPYSAGACIACNLFPDKKHINAIIRWTVQ